MKILGNIVPGFKAINAIKWFNKHKKELYAAREKEDYVTEREFILKAETSWGKELSKKLGIEIETVGKENLLKEGPVVYISNHQGYADILVLCAALDTVQFGYVAKKELGKIPFYGPAIQDIRSVMINRDDPRESVKAIFEGIDLLQKGFSLVIFPEGTRSKGGPIKEFHRGSFKLATKPKVPIIPVTIDGTYHVFEETGIIKPAKVKITIHPAIQTAELSKEEIKELPERVEAIVKSAI